jgi:translocator assembly and maintenance protein 41
MELLEQNLMRCVCCALLLINKPVFAEKELYIKATELSYKGDIRFLVKLENPDKVKNIVEGNLANFQKIYRAVIDKYFHRYVTYNDGNIYVNLSI